MTCKPNTKRFSVTIFNVPLYLFGEKFFRCTSKHQTELEAPIVSTKTQNRQYKTNVQNSQQNILGSKTVWKKRNLHLEKLNHVNTAIFFSSGVSAPRSQKFKMSSSTLGGSKAPNRFYKTGKGEIEGTIMLLSS